MVDIFQSTLLYTALAGLAVMLPILVARSNTALLIQERLLSFWRSLSPFGRIVVMSFLTVSILYGGSKPNSPVKLTTRPSVPVTSYAEKKAQNWNVRGAWKDSFWLKFADDWRFPYGTNHLRGVEVVSFGQLWPTPFNTNAVASIGAPIEIVPNLSSFSYEFTPSNSYRFAWGSAAVNRDTNDLMTASLELFRNGDACIVTNGVATYKERVLPFRHDGFGQDDEWVRANFTNATEILSIGYREWVDEQVGVGLENGLYKLTVTVSENPPETTQLKVGDYSVAVTNAGEYVFLLDKGIEYPISVFPETATNLSFKVTDEIDQESNFRKIARYASSDKYGQWSEDIGEALIIPPPKGLIIYMPKLRVNPKIWYPSLNNSNQVFEACVEDIRTNVLVMSGMSIGYQWRSHGSNVNIESDNKKTAKVQCDFPYGKGSMIELSLEAVLNGRILEVNYMCPVYKYNSVDYDNIWDGVGQSEVSILSSPEVIFFEEGRSNNINSDITCTYQVIESGVITLNIENGKNCEITDFNGNIVQDGYSWDVDERTSGMRCFWVEGLDKSSSSTGMVLKATYTPNTGSEKLEDSTRVVIYQVSTVADSSVNPRNRRDLGVRERVSIYIIPLPAEVEVENEAEDGMIERTNQSRNQWMYTAPACKTNDIVSISAGGFNYDIPFEIYEPTGITGRIKRETMTISENVSGEYFLEFNVHFTPTNVSFHALEFMELGMISTNATGYFLNPSFVNMLDHSLCGANVWGSIIDAIDYAGFTSECPEPWNEGGSFSWPIPIYWRVKSEPTTEKYLCTIEQFFSIDSCGTCRVSKFGYTGTCFTNRTHYVTKEFNR